MDSIASGVEEKVAQVVAAIRNVPGEMDKVAGNTAWTAAVKRRIREVGEANGYLVVPNDKEGQWLYDLVWFMNAENGHLRSIGLVLESEWSTADDWHIQFDFEKLLIAKSPIKVMLFQGSTAYLPQVFALLHEGINTYCEKNDQERYILAGYDTEQEQFLVELA